MLVLTVEAPESGNPREAKEVSVTGSGAGMILVRGNSNEVNTHVYIVYCSPHLIELLTTSFIALSHCH